MKKVLALIFVCLMMFSLIGCGDSSNNTDTNEPISNGKVKAAYFEAIILEVHDEGILVEPLEGSAELNSADKIYVSLHNVDVDFDLAVGDPVGVNYDGLIAESYPAQINGTFAILSVKEAAAE